MVGGSTGRLHGEGTGNLPVIPRLGMVAEKYWKENQLKIMVKWEWNANGGGNKARQRFSTENNGGTW